MQQIADHLNISKFVVSKALSGKNGISEETREKVIKSAVQLGYLNQKRLRVPNLNKSYNGSTSKKTDTDKNTVMVTIPNHRYHQNYSYFWGEILNGISSRLEKNNLGMMVVTEYNTENFWQVINPEKLFGIIGVGQISNQLLLEVKSFEIPLVLIDYEDPLIPSDTLFTDNYECIKRVTSYLIELGHKSFQFVGNIRTSRSYFERWMGFRSTLEEHQYKVNQNQDFLNLESNTKDEFTEEIKQLTKLMIKDKTLPTAFVCANDAIAISTITALKQLGFKVPEDCSVIGFDNIEESLIIEPSLSTVHVEKEVLGNRAADKLLWRLSNKESPFEKLLLHGELIIRESTGTKKECVS
jgi:LacI family transcriptional regulator